MGRSATLVRDRSDDAEEPLAVGFNPPRRCREAIDRSQEAAAVVGRLPPLSGGDRSQSEGCRHCREVIDCSQKAAAVVGR